MKNKENKKMKISNVQVYPINVNNLVANVSICFDDVLVVRCKLIEGKNGMFVSFPNHSYTDKGATKYADDVYIMDKEFVADVTDAVIAEYEKTTEVEEKPKKKYTRRK